MRTTQLAVSLAAALAGLALLGAAAYLHVTRAPTAPPTPAAGQSTPPRPGFAFTPLAEPRPLAELQFIDGAGRAVSLTDFRGRVVLLNAWATWCVPCRAEMPSLDRLQEKLGGPDFEVVALSIDRGGLPVVEAFYDDLKLAALRVYLDQPGEAMRALGIAGLPTTLLIDRAGREIGRVVGAAEWDGPAAVEVIRRYLDTPSGAAPSAARWFAAGGPASTALPSSYWKVHIPVLKEKGHERA